MNGLIDLRSDTVTTPTEAMRAAMAAAKVGDEVFDEDPTVDELEALAARMLGAEAGLFVSSGTMGNLLAALCHCRPGESIIVDQDAHMFHFEAGGAAAVGGLTYLRLPMLTPDGHFTAEHIPAEVRRGNVHYPFTTMLVLENTHNLSGGLAMTVQETQEASRVARDFGLWVHLDGARLFNAAVALGMPAAQLAAPADSVSICLSKALGAPVGSVLLGPRSFVEAARQKRKMLGGGMRQAGVLAAAGLLALHEHVPLLGRDHQVIQAIARIVADLPGLEIAQPRVDTNMLYWRPVGSRIGAQQAVAILKKHGILAFDVRGTIRFVSHHQVGHEALPRIRAALEQVSREALG